MTAFTPQQPRLMLARLSHLLFPVDRDLAVDVGHPSVQVIIHKDRVEGSVELPNGTQALWVLLRHEDHVLVDFQLFRDFDEIILHTGVPRVAWHLEITDLKPEDEETCPFKGFECYLAPFTQRDDGATVSYAAALRLLTPPFQREDEDEDA